MSSNKNPYVLPAVIIAIGIVAAAIAFRVLPGSGRGTAPFGAEQDPIQIPDSARASLVTHVSGSRVTVQQAAEPGRRGRVVTLVMNAATAMFDADGLPLKDRRLKVDDLIEFYPSVVPDGATEMNAEGIRLLFRPPENR